MTKPPKQSPDTTKKPFGNAAAIATQSGDALDIKIQELEAKFNELGWYAVIEPFRSRVAQREDLNEEDKKHLLIDYLNVYLDFKNRNRTAGDLGLVMDVYDKIAEARTDELTGIKNRKAFQEAFHFEQYHLQRLAQESGRNNVPASSLVLFDLNGFKTINDTLGHLAGDKALKHFSQIVSKTIRKTDGFYRTGGDEFSLILQGQDQDNAQAVIDKIRQALLNNPFQWNGQKITLQTSAGIASITIEKNMAETIDQADQAMYADKNQNRPHSSPREPVSP